MNLLRPPFAIVLADDLPKKQVLFADQELVLASEWMHAEETMTSRARGLNFRAIPKILEVVILKRADDLRHQEIRNVTCRTA